MSQLCVWRRLMRSDANLTMQTERNTSQPKQQHPESLPAIADSRDKSSKPVIHMREFTSKDLPYGTYLIRIRLVVYDKLWNFSGSTRRGIILIKKTVPPYLRCVP